MEFTSVVFPTPGPPVITTIRLAKTVFSASRWLGASVLPVRPSHHATAWSKSIGSVLDAEHLSIVRALLG